MAWPFDNSDALDRIEKTLNRIEGRMWLIQKGIKQMSRTLDELLTTVAAETTVVDSVVELVKGLRDQIAALPDMTPELQAKVDSMFDAVTADTAKLAASVTVNTPSAVV